MLVVPAHVAPAQETTPASLLEEGRTAASAGDLAKAYEALGSALRQADDQAGKNAARNELLNLKTPRAPALTEMERGVVVARIDQERSRHLRDVANKLLGKKKLKGALKLLEEIKGSLEEEATAKVIGDPKAAERRGREVSDLKIRIFTDMPEKRKVLADELVVKYRETPDRLLREARKLHEDGKSLAARRALSAFLFNPGNPAEAKKAARDLIASIEKDVLDDLDAEERKAVEGALKNPVFGRLTALPSQEFIFIGDIDLVERIPERSRYVLDLAYIALTDLVGRVPNPQGDRVTIFFKELWDFGGGIGGGKKIDIGRADPTSKRAVIVNSGLYFHELSHCIFDLKPDFPGWVEGIANFGAAFCSSFLRQDTDEWHSARGNLDAFKQDFLDREMRYWRTSPYGPSAGFFLHWIAKYGKAGKEYDWIRYGRIFRAWRALDPKPRSVPAIARTFGHLLAGEFGPAVWKDLEAQGFPCEGGAAGAELDAVTRPALLRDASMGDPDAWESLLTEHRGSAETAVILRQMIRNAADDEEAAPHLEALGAVRDWRVCGPFYPEPRGNGLASIFPPEREVRLERSYRSRQESAKWYVPTSGEEGIVHEDTIGRVTAKWAYPRNSVTYGVVDIDVPEAVDAWAWVTTEHKWALWVDGRLVEKQEWGAGRWMPDRDRVPLRLEKGTHRVILKVVLGHMGPHFMLRFTDRQGRGLPGMTCRPVEESPWPAPGEHAWRPHFEDSFMRSSLGRNWKAGPGGFKVKKGLAAGTDKKGRVPWRKYSVRPGFPQDSPSNQLTLSPKRLVKVGKDLLVAVGTEQRKKGLPKIAVTLDAEEAAGGLTGWTVVVVPRGGEVDCRLERYDRLVHLGTGIKVPKAKEHLLEIERVGGLVTVRLDGHDLLDRVSATPLGRQGLRICTWGTEPAVSIVRVLAPQDKK
jgi:hypothetical protein